MTHEEHILYLRTKYSGADRKPIVDDQMKKLSIAQAVYINLNIIDEMGRLIEYLFF